jgi:PelA/Pel-15E family pectate lyase
VDDWSYKTKSKIPELNGKTGQFTSVPENSLPPFPNAVKHTRWWTDILDPKYKEEEHSGAKTVNAFRRQYLRHFAQRADRCIAPTISNKEISWRQALDQPEDWYSSIEAIRIVDNLLHYQRDIGGWTKNVDMAKVLTEHERNKLLAEKEDSTGVTIDNGATHSQMRFLAKVYTATRQDRFKVSFLKGIDYLLEAQYSNGGWPQYYPIRKGYYQHITYNDDAMIGVMKLLSDIVNQNPNFTFVKGNYHNRVKQAYEKGLEVILKCQVRVRRELTAWCAQHDEVTLEPVQARSYELASLSGSESVNILRFLMGIDNPDPQVKMAILAGCKWFENSKITGQRLVRKMDPKYEKGYDQVLEPDPEAPPLWARFYDIQTSRPIFPTRDGVAHKKFSNLTYERRNGYRYLGHFAEELLTEDFPEWKKKWMQK